MIRIYAQLRVSALATLLQPLSIRTLEWDSLKYEYRRGWANLTLNRMTITRSNLQTLSAWRRQSILLIFPF